MEISKKEIKSFFNRYWAVILIILLGAAVSFSWFREGFLIAGGDDGFYLNPIRYFSENFSSWLGRINLGSPNVTLSSLFPLVSFWAFFKAIGFSLISIEKLWFTLLFIMPSLSV